MLRATLMLLLLSSSVQSSHQEIIDDILESLSKGVTFFDKQCRNINLDGVVGYVILKAQLQEATRSWPNSDFLSLFQRSIALSLVKKLDRSLSHAVTSLQETDSKYYKEFEPILDTSFWSLPREWSFTDPTLVYSSTRTTECYDEQQGDKCLTLLLGTWKDNGTPCIVTKSCRDTMTRFGCPHYSLSHQLLYFMVGTMKGCSRMLKGDLRLSRVNITVEHYQKIFCSNMMKGNQEIVSSGFTSQIQDIFIENILLCGLAGFSDFYKADWLQHILAWQDKKLGCFGKDDGCSSHMTGVAMSALGGYLNFYLSEQDITKRPLI
ncbi:UPF0764 protein C16orf89 homolog isoform X2 [Brachyhypopomus gauderio]|uniref:UPF0764 protein C16orf89 homolog isoform X2 n=1 Tax=Brachyhypopomus gauderio TaxID=698409 RepID=UPI004042E5FA